MPWYAIVALILFIIAPFDAFYQYNKLVRRREEQRRKGQRAEESGKNAGGGASGAPEETQSDREEGEHSA